MRVKSVIALLLILASATGCTSGHERQVALPDQLVPVWSAAIPPSDGVPVFAVTADSVIATTSHGNLAILDARTGRLERTIEPDTGWSFSSGTVIGERLYTDQTTQDPTIRRLVAYDLSTGRSIWRNDFQSQMYGVFSSDYPTITSRGIVVPIGAAQEGAADDLQGISLTDGTVVWQTQLPSGCPTGTSPDALGASTPGVGIARAAVFLLVCINGVRLVSVDPADGRISWQRVLAANPSPFHASNPAYSAVVTTNLGDIVVKTGTKERIFTSSGQLIATRICPSSDDCNIDAVGRSGVLSLHLRKPPIEQGLDLSTGQLVWQRTGTLINPYGGSAASPDYGGILYAEADYRGLCKTPLTILLPER
jgi:outer membrane protein assembly factor BamB